MKSSTIRRSALSKESMDVIENLSNESPKDNQAENDQSENNTPGEYRREGNSEQETDNRSKEIDLLWQTFKSPQFTTNSTFAHVFCGFILGVVVSAAVLALFIMFALNSDNPSKYNMTNIFKNNSQTEKISSATENAEAIENSQTSSIEEIETPAIENETAGTVQEENSVTTDEKKNAKAKKSKNAKNISETAKKIQVKKYIIKDGDTVEGIIKHNYGAYTQERADAIMKVNHLKDLDHIGIDQELLLPVEK